MKLLVKLEANPSKITLVIEVELKKSEKNAFKVSVAIISQKSVEFIYSQGIIILLKKMNN